MPSLQEAYDAAITKLEPIMPVAGLSPEEYAGTAMAMLTCAVDICRTSQRIPEGKAKSVVQSAWQHIGKELQQLTQPPE